MPKRKTDETELQENMQEQNEEQNETVTEEVDVVDDVMEEDTLQTIDENELAPDAENKAPATELTEKDAEEFEEEASMADAFLRRTITLPGRRKRRAVFREEERIVGDDNDELDTFASMKKREYDMLADSAKAQKPKVLYGRIIGSEEVQVGSVRTVNAVCNLITDKRADINTDRELRSGIYKINIPAPMLFINREEHLGEAGYDALKKNVEMRIGSVVEFVVYDLKPDDINVLASRLRAMQILSYDYYLGRKAQIKPGTLAKGYITYVNASGVMVDVFGAEFFIPRNELAWKFVRNPIHEKDLFKVGKAVTVRIKTVAKATQDVYEYKQPYLLATGSIKDSKPNPNEVFFDKYVVGQKYKAEIAYKTMAGEYIVNLGSESDGIDGDRAICFCKAPSIELGGTPRLHQECLVAILMKDDTTHRLVGAFTYLEP